MSDGRKFSKFVIVELLGTSSRSGFIERWEDWLALEATNPHTKVFHATIIRFMKGIIRAWRRWLLETSEEEV